MCSQLGKCTCVEESPKDSTPRNMPKKTGKEFIWTDDEAELLLNVAIEYKTMKAAESVHWEFVKSKYSNITDNFWQHSLQTMARTALKVSHTAKINKQVVTSKLKAVRVKFRQVMDSGQRSGHGRVVLLHYELCE